MRTLAFNIILLGSCLGLLAATSQTANALPLGYTKTTIPLNAPPSGLAYDSSGNLYAFETPAFGNNTATVRVFQPNLVESPSFTVTGSDTSFFLGGMTYDPIDNAILFTDNTFGANALYSYDLDTSTQTTIATGISSIAGVAVRSTGEIFVSTAPFADNAGEVLTINRSTGAPTSVMSGLDFGAGLAFDAAGDLIVQDADFNSPYLGHLQKLPITGVGPLTFDPTEVIFTGLQAAAGIAIDSEGDYFITGSGGLFEIKAGALVANSFDDNGSAFQFSTAIAFFPGSNSFEPFSTDGGRLAFLSDFGFGQEDDFITLITTGTNSSLSAIPEPGTGIFLLLGSLLLIRMRKTNQG